ncbi:hypothetical protein L1887_29231 [Cichorium endivia]|nr:hypothetical protein L1887_29231 [Cichorium endivia]
MEKPDAIPSENITTQPSQRQRALLASLVSSHSPHSLGPQFSPFTLICLMLFNSKKYTKISQERLICL